MTQNHQFPSLGNHRLLSLLLISTISNSSYSSIAPILPIEMDKHEIPQSFVSLVFLFFPIGYSMTSLVISRYFETVGTEKVMALGMAAQSILFCWLGHIFELPFVNNDGYLEGGEPHENGHSMMILIGLLTMTEFCLGCAMSVIATGVYSMATLLFPLEKESAISFVEMAVGMGYIIGPIVGSYIYEEKGYHSAYLTVSFGMATTAIFTWKVLAPYLRVKIRCHSGEDLDAQMIVGLVNDSVDYDCKSLDEQNNMQHEGMNYMSIESQSALIPKQKRPAPPSSATTKNPTSWTLLRNPKISIAATSILCTNLAWTFMEPILAKRLDGLHVSQKWIGVVFALTNIVYVPSAYLMQHLPKQWNRHSMIAISIALTPIAILMAGSNHFPLLIAGITCIGFFPTPVWIMLLPTMQEDVLATYPDPSLRRSLNDVTAGIYSSFMTLGQVVGYVIGPLLNGRFGFAITTHVVAALIFLQSMMFYFFGAGGLLEKIPMTRRRLGSSSGNLVIKL